MHFLGSECIQNAFAETPYDDPLAGWEEARSVARTTLPFSRPLQSTLKSNFSLHCALVRRWMDECVCRVVSSWIRASV